MGDVCRSARRAFGGGHGVAGDENDGCLEPGVMLKRTLPAAGLTVLANPGHTCNLEEPELLNEAVERFLVAVELGRWPSRDPRSHASSLTAMNEHGLGDAR